MSSFKQQKLTNPQLYPSNQSMWAKRSGVTLSSIFRFVGVRNEIIK